MTAVQMTPTISVELVRCLADDRFVAEAARVSTLAEVAALAALERSNVGLLGALMRDQHGSPFEHTFFTFRVHAPLDVMTEHLRHRAGWSYNGWSGRYSEMLPVFYSPPAERGVTQVGKAIAYDIRPGSRRQRLATRVGARVQAGLSWRVYRGLLRLGVAREVARRVLPTSLMTTYYTSCNARSLMAFLALRGEGTHALWEIQQVAAGYEAALAEHMPITHAAFVESGRTAP